MCPHRFLRVLVNSYVSLWVLMCSFGFFMDPGFYGSLCILLGLYGSLWVLVGSYGFLWVLMCFYGYL